MSHLAAQEVALQGVAPTVDQLDLDRLLALRLVVARTGEMDVAKWWNSKGQLGRGGALALRRGFPRTHPLARARSVFAVAGARCAEIVASPDAVTLWRLPAQLEEEFDARWEHWLDQTVAWQSFFTGLEGLATTDVLTALQALALVDERADASLAGLARAPDGRSVPIAGAFSHTDEDLTRLALGFALGDVAALAVPYMRRGDS